jgi:hypothetical protein
MRLFGKVCVISVACLLGAGCGEKDDEEAAKSELEGTWNQTCGTDSPADSTDKEYDVSSITFTASTVVFSATNYGTDSTCAAKSISSQVTGTYTGGEDVTTPAGAKTFDLTPSAVTLTLHTDENVTQFNDGSVCGGGWVKDTVKTVTKEACTAADFIVEIFDPAFSIYKVDGSNLYLGDEEASTKDGKTAANREDVLDTRPFVR